MRSLRQLLATKFGATRQYLLLKSVVNYGRDLVSHTELVRLYKHLFSFFSLAMMEMLTL